MSNEDWKKALGDSTEHITISYIDKLKKENAELEQKNKTANSQINTLLSDKDYIIKVLKNMQPLQGQAIDANKITTFILNLESIKSINQTLATGGKSKKRKIKTLDRKKNRKETKRVNKRIS